MAMFCAMTPQELFLAARRERERMKAQEVARESVSPTRPVLPKPSQEACPAEAPDGACSSSTSTVRGDNHVA
jgi:hypothetical protein